jgi:hypothetical protein
VGVPEIAGATVSTGTPSVVPAGLVLAAVVVGWAVEAEGTATPVLVAAAPGPVALDAVTVHVNESP